MFLQLGFGLVLEGANIGHSHAVPLVEPAEHLPMEIGEESTFGLHDELLDARLKAEPLELAGDQLVSAHNRRRITARSTPIARQRAATSLLGTKFGRILFRFVVASLNRVVRNVDVNDLRIGDLMVGEEERKAMILDKLERGKKAERWVERITKNHYVIMDFNQ